MFLLFFLLWHSLDLKASVTETGNTWLFGWSFKKCKYQLQ